MLITVLLICLVLFANMFSFGYNFTKTKVMLRQNYLFYFSYHIYSLKYNKHKGLQKLEILKPCLYYTLLIIYTALMDFIIDVLAIALYCLPILVIFISIFVLTFDKMQFKLYTLNIKEFTNLYVLATGGALLTLHSVKAFVSNVRDNRYCL
jgi:hypothetical protein